MLSGLRAARAAIRQTAFGKQTCSRLCEFLTGSEAAFGVFSSHLHLPAGPIFLGAKVIMLETEGGKRPKPHGCRRALFKKTIRLLQ